jgi:hypothetical protein
MSTRPSRLRRALLSLGIAAAGCLAAIDPVGALPQPPLRSLASAGPAVSGGLAVDAAGDVFMASPWGDAIYVLPAVSGTLFGQQVEQGVEVQLRAATGLDLPSGIAFDAAGDLFIANAGYADSVTVVAAADRTIFGQAMVANRSATLSAAQGIITPMGMAFDAAGDLYVVSESLGGVAVVPSSTTSLFGQAVTENTTSFLSAASTVDLPGPAGLAIDGAGRLLFSNRDNVAVLSAVPSTLFGQTLLADQATILDATSGLNAAHGSIDDIALSPAGDLFVLQNSLDGVTTSVVASPGTTSVLGQAVTAGTAVALDQASVPEGYASALVVDASGNLITGLSTTLSAGVPNLAINVIPASSGTFCGQAVVAGQRTAIPPSLPFILYPGIPSQVAVDQTGNAYVAGPPTGGILVVPAASGTLFGQTVARGTPTILDATAGQTVATVAVDAAGDLIFGTGEKGGYWVVAPTPTTLFGQRIEADVRTQIAVLAGRKGALGLAIDPAGNLLGTMSDKGLWILPAASGPGYGRDLTAGRPTTLASTTELTGPIAVDPQGHVFVVEALSDGGYVPGSVAVYSPRSETVLGQSIPSGALTELTSMAAPEGAAYTGLATTSAGDLVASALHFGQSGSDGALVVDPTADGSRWGQGFTASTPSVLGSSLDHAGFISAAVGPGDGLFGLSMTGLWGIGGTIALASPDRASARIGRSGTIRVETIGGLTIPEVSLVGGLPDGMSLTDDGDGSATISGAPADGTPKKVLVTVRATDHVSDPVEFVLRLTVAADDTLRPGEGIGVGEPLRSRNGWYTLALSYAGNLVLRTDGGRRLWSSRTKGSGAVRATYSRHGVLKLLDPAGHRVYRAGSRQSAPQRLRLLSNGDLVAVAGGAISWHTDTAGASVCSAPHHVC